MPHYDDLRTAWGTRLLEEYPGTVDALLSHWCRYSSRLPDWAPHVRRAVAEMLGSGFTPGDEFDLCLHEGQQPSFDLSSWSKRATLTEVATAIGAPAFSVVHDAVTVSSYPLGVVLRMPIKSGGTEDVSLIPSLISAEVMGRGSRHGVVDLPYSARRGLCSENTYDEIAVRDYWPELQAGIASAFECLSRNWQGSSLFSLSDAEVLSARFLDVACGCCDEGASLATIAARSQKQLFEERLCLRPRLIHTSRLFGHGEFQVAVHRAIRAMGSVPATVRMINEVTADLKQRGVIAKGTSVRLLAVAIEDDMWEVPVWMPEDRSVQVIWSQKAEALGIRRHGGKFERIDEGTVLWPKATLLGMLMLGTFATGWEWGGGSYIQVVLEILRRVTGVSPPVFNCSQWYRRGMYLGDNEVKKPPLICSWAFGQVSAGLFREIMIDCDVKAGRLTRGLGEAVRIDAR